MPFVEKIEFRLEEAPDREVYPFSLPALQGVYQLDIHPNVTFLVGENGSGKSTLLEAIASKAGFPLSGGPKPIDPRVEIPDTPLSPYLRLSWGQGSRHGFYLRAESFNLVAQDIDQNQDSSYYGGELSRMSHGETFLGVFTNKCREPGLYLMDEPEAALSPSRQIALLSVLSHHIFELGSQFIIATHSPIILAFPKAIIYELTDRGMQAVAYEDTDHYRLTKEFLNNPQVFLRALRR